MLPLSTYREIAAMIAPDVASELDHVLESFSKRLLAITEESAGKRPKPEPWCKKLAHPGANTG